MDYRYFSIASKSSKRNDLYQTNSLGSSPQHSYYPDLRVGNPIPTFRPQVYHSINENFSKVTTDDSSFIEPLAIHREYGVIDIPGIVVINIQESTHKGKKYAITVQYQGRTSTIHYGNPDYEQYEDRTPLRAFSNQDHHDEKRRRSYLARSSAITDYQGLACNNPFSANRYAIITLW